MIKMMLPFNNRKHFQKRLLPWCKVWDFLRHSTLQLQQKHNCSSSFSLTTYLTISSQSSPVSSACIYKSLNWTYSKTGILKTFHEYQSPFLCYNQISVVATYPCLYPTGENSRLEQPRSVMSILDYTVLDYIFPLFPSFSHSCCPSLKLLWIAFL